MANYEYRIKVTLTENYRKWYMPQRRLKTWYGRILGWVNLNEYFGGGFNKRFGCMTLLQAERLIRDDRIIQNSRVEDRKSKTPRSKTYININD